MPLSSFRLSQKLAVFLEVWTKIMLPCSVRAGPVSLGLRQLNRSL